MRYDNIVREITDNAPKLNFVYTIKDFQIYSDNFNSCYKYVGASIGSRDEKHFDFSPMKYPIIYISLGTLLNTSVKFFRKCIDAFQAQPVSVIMSIGSIVKLEQLGKIPNNFFVYPFVPQLEILQKASLFITHGGMNSVNEALFYGTPMLVIPVGNDQPTVAQQIETLHLGKYMKQKGLDAASLQFAAMEILNNNDYKKTLQKFQMKSQTAGGNMEIARQILDELNN